MKNTIDSLVTGDKLSGPGFPERLLGLNEEQAMTFNEDRFDGPSLKRTASPKTKLCIPSLKSFQVVEIASIVYCEASSNYTIFHFTDRASICACKTIYEYEDLLGDCNFLRIHRSFVVNMEHIKEYVRGEGGTIILANGHELEVSRRKRDTLMIRMKECYKW